jgi:fatty-acyl-CoA synthase
MTPGLMQPVPVQISTILRYAAAAHPRREIVSRLIDEPIWGYNYAGLAAHALRHLGVDPGDTVSTLA